MAGIDDYMFYCNEEDEESWWREREYDRELDRQSIQIRYEAEARRKIHE